MGKQYVKFMVQKEGRRDISESFFLIKLKYLISIEKNRYSYVS